MIQNEACGAQRVTADHPARVSWEAGCPVSEEPGEVSLKVGIGVERVPQGMGTVGGVALRLGKILADTTQGCVEGTHPATWENVKCMLHTPQ